MATGAILLLARCAGFARAVARRAGRAGLQAAGLVAFGAALEGVGILLLVPVLAAVFEVSVPTGPLGSLVQALPAGLPAGARLALLMGMFATVMVARAGVLWLRDARLAALQVGFVEDLRRELGADLLAAPWERLARLGHARVHHLMGADIQRCAAGVHFLLQGGTACVVILAQLSAALLLSPPLALGAALLFTGGALVLNRLLVRAHAAGRGVSHANLALTEEVGRFLSGMKVAISQNLQPAFLAAFGEALSRARREQTAFQRQQSLIRGLWSLLGMLVAVGVVCAGFSWLGVPGPVLLALLVVLGRLSAPAAQIQVGLQQIAYALPAWEEIAAIRRDLGVLSPPPARGAPPPAGAIALDHVTYLHESGRGVRGVDLRLEPGEMVGLAGASGAGKTTIADLLCGLLSPQEGAIRIGGAALTAERAPAWREQIAYVAQDAVMFNDTVRANLAWAMGGASGGRGVSEEAMARALARTGADAVVARLPQGLDTVIGERGLRLSGGERQRLALARALLRAPRLLILDEATNAIDAAGERAVLARLRALSPRPAILVIAHRAETLAACGRVVVLDEGRAGAEMPA